MRWTKKIVPEGERRTETCFAWFPTSLNEPEHCVVWLENYKRDIVYYASERGWIIVKEYLCETK